MLREISACIQTEIPNNLEVFKQQMTFQCCGNQLQAITIQLFWI